MLQPGRHSTDMYQNDQENGFIFYYWVIHFLFNIDSIDSDDIEGGSKQWCDCKYFNCDRLHSA